MGESYLSFSRGTLQEWRNRVKSCNYGCVCLLIFCSSSFETHFGLRPRPFLHKWMTFKRSHDACQVNAKGVFITITSTYSIHLTLNTGQWYIETSFSCRHRIIKHLIFRMKKVVVNCWILSHLILCYTFS